MEPKIEPKTLHEMASDAALDLWSQAGGIRAAWPGTYHIEEAIKKVAIKYAERVPSSPAPRLEFQADRMTETEWSADTWLVLPNGKREVLGWMPCDSQEEADEKVVHLTKLYAEAVPSFTAGPLALSADQIKRMVERFLQWKLPENFNPDGGISFKKTFNEHTAHPMKHEPVGTNLFDFNQAEEMIRYIFDPPDRTQSVSAKFRPKREFIGTVRYRLFANVDCEWNGVVRDITAQLERDETVNTEMVLVQLAEFYRARAHWARFKEAMGREEPV